jgi:hypothetical protein
MATVETDALAPKAARRFGSTSLRSPGPPCICGISCRCAWDTVLAPLFALRCCPTRRDFTVGRGAVKPSPAVRDDISGWEAVVQRPGLKCSSLKRGSGRASKVRRTFLLQHTWWYQRHCAFPRGWRTSSSTQTLRAAHAGSRIQRASNRWAGSGSGGPAAIHSRWYLGQIRYIQRHAARKRTSSNKSSILMATLISNSVRTPHSTGRLTHDGGTICPCSRHRTVQAPRKSGQQVSSCTAAVTRRRHQKADMNTSPDVSEADCVGNGVRMASELC